MTITAAQHRTADVATRPQAGTRPSPETWRVVGCSARGAGHVRTGEPCQDAHAWRVAPGALVAAVADGAGSARLGGVGAAVAARSAAEALADSLGTAGDGGDVEAPDDGAWRARLGAAIEAARAAVAREAEARAAEIGELATTLIVLAVTDDVVAVAQVGDGAAVARGAAGTLEALTTPHRGEFVNETTFLSSPDAAELAQLVVRREAVTHVAVLSDGLQMLALAMPSGSPHPPFFAPLFAFAAGAADPAAAAEQLASFLTGPRVAARTDDDVTLLLAARVRG